MNDPHIAKVFKAMSDESRLLILTQLQSGERCACHLLETLEISQSTLSHHMKILCDAGLVFGRKEGKWTHYSLQTERISEAMHYLSQMRIPLADKGGACCDLA